MTPTTSSLQQPATFARTANLLLAIFLGAIAIRWLYDMALFFSMGRDGLMEADSYGYFRNAQAMVSQAMSGNLHGWAWLGPDHDRMPLYPWLLMSNIAAFGSYAPLTTVLIQGVLDGATCLLVYRIAGVLDQRIAIPAAIGAALNPTQIVLSGLIYTDTLFVFFVALFTWGAASWLREPSWKSAITIGVGLGFAALTRIVVAPWVPVFIVVLLLGRLFVDQVRRRHVAQLAAMAAIFCLGILPVLTRNVTQYGSWQLTPQGGNHLAFWIVPLVREAKDGTPWQKSVKKISKRLRELDKQAPPRNEFDEAARHAEFAREELIKLGLPAIIKAWTIGAAINLAAPAIIISPLVEKLPRTGFYATSGDTMTKKIVNFMFHSDNALYAWALLLGVAGVGIVRLLQLAGGFYLLRQRHTWPVLAMMALWIGFILAANGPIASPKYRLPIEPVLCVLTGAGIGMLRRPKGSEIVAQSAAYKRA
ncbi:MAG: glycosyltransferase family 39 protein [Pseudolabrys sp.]